MVKSLKDSKVQVQELEKSLADARVRVHELEGSPPNQWSIPEPLASVSRPDSAPGVGDKEEDSVSARVDAVERTIEKEVLEEEEDHCPVTFHPVPSERVICAPVPGRVQGSEAWSFRAVVKVEQ